MADKMNEPNENPRRYRWPWLVAAAVVLGIVLAIIWVGFAVLVSTGRRAEGQTQGEVTPGTGSEVLPLPKTIWR